MNKTKTFVKHSFFQLLVLFIMSSTVFAGEIKLAWDASPEPVSGYRLYYGLSSGNYTENIDVGKVTTYTLTGLQDGQTYYIATTAYNDLGESDYSNEVSGVPGPDNEESPTVTISSPTTGDTYATEEDTITLGGSAADNVGVTSVTWINDRGGSGTVSGTDSWTIPNISLQEGNNVITVTAHDAAGNTGSDTLTVTYTSPDFQPPTIPSGLQASSVSSTQINLTWTASTDDVGITGYIIYRDGVQVDTSPANSYSDTGLSPSTTYTYAVSAYDAGNESSQSSSASATTPAAPAFIEAQSGTITSPMQIVSDVDASEGAYIQTTQVNSGTAVYAFNIEESGIYKIIAKVYALDGGSDSFYVKIDDGEEFIWHLNPSGNPDEFNVWREDEVNNQGTGTWDNPQYDPHRIELTQGTHTITFRGRETNCRLDYFYFLQVDGLSDPKNFSIIN